MARREGCGTNRRGPNALAALGVHALASDLDLSGYRLITPATEQAAPINGPSGMGADDRFVFTVVFEQDGRLLVLFMTPGGVLIGHVFVPVALVFGRGDLTVRGVEELGRLFREWNGRR